MKIVKSQAGAIVSRRGFLQGIAGGVAVAAYGGDFARLEPSAGGLAGEIGRVLPAPKPIPGGIDVPPVIHVWGPGTEGKVLPYTGGVLQGLDVEPGTMTDFKGVIAQAYHVGTATGSDGNPYNVETDLRVMQGQYVAEDGSQHTGTFALF